MTKHKKQKIDPYKIITFNIYDDGKILKSDFHTEGFSQDRKGLAKLLMSTSFATVGLMQRYKVDKKAFLANIGLLWDEVNKSTQTEDKKEQ